MESKGKAAGEFTHKGRTFELTQFGDEFQLCSSDESTRDWPSDSVVSEWASVGVRRDGFVFPGLAAYVVEVPA